MRLGIFSLLLGAISPLWAETSVVDSIAALQAKIAEAKPGDTVVVKSGVYTTSAALTMSRSGTATDPITIRAEKNGEVEIGGTHGFNLDEPAANVVITGFKFTHAAGKASIGDGTSAIRFTGNTFLCTGDGAYLAIAGDDAQIDHNEFGAKKSPGTMISVSGTGSQVARRLWIHHNFFHDFDNDGASGAEMIRVGLLSAHRLSSGATLIEHNLFLRCRGTNDMISIRCSGVTVRYNTFLDSPTSHLTVRQGNECTVAGNYFRNTEGVRLYGDRHQVFSNYFEGNYIGVNLGNGDVELAQRADAPANSHDRPDDCVIAFNTFIENNTHFQMSKRSGEALGATNTVFANNLIVGGATAAKIDGPFPGAVWTGNLVWNTPKPRDLPETGHVKADPLLAADADGIKRPGAGSPVIAAALGTFPAVSFDMDGQARPEKKSVGADEPSTQPVLARILSEKEVGPNAVERESTSPTAPPADPTPTASPASAPAPSETPREAASKGLPLTSRLEISACAKAA
jgi:poly(beta-D-mannuronate) lyase